MKPDTHSISPFFQAPSFDDPAETRQARLLHRILIAGMLMAAFMAVAVVVLVPTPTRSLFITIALFLLEGGLYLLLRSGRGRLASTLLIAVIGTLLIFSATVNGGVRSVSFSALVVVVLTGGLLLGPHATLVLTALGSLIGLAFLYADRIGVLPPAATTPNTILWMANSLSFLWSALVLYTALEGLDRAWRRVMGELAERKKAQEASLQSAHRLEILRDIERELLEARSIAVIAHVVLHHLKEILHCQRVSIVYFDEDYGVARLLQEESDVPGPWIDGRTRPLDHFDRDDLGASAFHYTPDLTAEASSNVSGPIYEHLRSEGLRTILIVPLRAQGRVIGSLNLGARPPHAFDTTAIEIAQEVGRALAVATVQTRLLEETQKDARHLELLNLISQTALEATAPEDALATLAGQLRELFLADRCSVYMCASDRTEPELVGSSPTRGQRVDALHREQGHILSEAVVREGRVLVCDQDELTAYQATANATPIQALGLPLKAGLEKLGAVTLHFLTPRHFSRTEIERAEQATHHLALALSKLRLFDAERRHREEADTLREVTSALTTTLDLTQVLRRILTHLERLIPHQSASVILQSEEGLQHVSHHGRQGTPFSQLLAEIQESPSRGALFDDAEVRVVEDLREHPRWRDYCDPDQAVSWMSVPLIAKGKTTGWLILERLGTEAFDGRGAGLAQAFANQAALAIANARAYDETQRAYRESERRVKALTILHDVSQTLTADTLRIDEIGLTIARQFADALGIPECSLLLLDPAGKTLRVLTDYLVEGKEVRDEVEWRGREFAVKDYPATARVLNTLEPLTIRRSDPDADPAELAYMQEVGVSTLAIFPLAIKGEAIGILELESEEEHIFTSEQINLAMTLANQAAVALENARLFEETHRRLEHLQALRTIDQAITGSVDLHLTLEILLDQTTAQLGVDAAAVLLLSQPTQTLEIAARRGFRTQALRHTRLAMGEGLAGRAALERRPVFRPSLKKDSGSLERSHLLPEEGFVAYYAVPLLAKGEVKGVLEVYHRSAIHPAPEWRELLETLAGQAAIAIDSAEMFEGLQRSNLELALAYDTTLEGWARTLELRDRETEGHTRRVTELTLQLARRLGIPDDELIHIRRGALLHDIGKMGIPDRILLKPGPLSDEEWAVMHRHPSLARELLAPITFLRPALAIPYAHHERWDGTGYPRGLKGEDIPLAARIFAVVDVWDALRSDRPYRPAWTDDRALEHIREQSGNHFDPGVVNAFLELLEEQTQAEAESLHTV